MSMEDLILTLRVEKDHIKGGKIEGEKSNIIEGAFKPKFQKNKGIKIVVKGVKPLAPKGKDFKKIKRTC